MTQRNQTSALSQRLCLLISQPLCFPHIPKLTQLLSTADCVTYLTMCPTTLYHWVDFPIWVLFHPASGKGEWHLGIVGVGWAWGWWHCSTFSCWSKNMWCFVGPQGSEWLKARVLKSDGLDSTPALSLPSSMTLTDCLTSAIVSTGINATSQPSFEDELYNACELLNAWHSELANNSCYHIGKEKMVEKPRQWLWEAAKCRMQYLGTAQ